MKRIVSFLLAAAMSLSLAACSKAAGSISASEQGRTAAEAEEISSMSGTITIEAVE